jgi:hypothetical protein
MINEYLNLLGSWIGVNDQQTLLSVLMVALLVLLLTKGGKN